MKFRTKEEQIADFLREGIISGRFPRGARLKQQEISELMETSITPVREALKLLEAEGYVVGNSYRGSVVAPFDMEASTETLNLRILLETELVRGVVARVTAADLEELRQLEVEFERAIKAGENEAARAANYRFHHRMFEIAQMPQTLNFVQILWARYPFDMINQLKGRISRAADEHKELFDALASSNVTDAILATRRHIESGWTELRDALAEAAEAKAGKGKSAAKRNPKK